MILNKPFDGNFPITQAYGEAITSKFHTGIDYALPMGTPIRAAHEGLVFFAGEDNTGYGLCVMLKAWDNSGTVYAHCSELFVKKGDLIQPGDIIAKSGTSGRSTGPHMHFEYRLQALDWKTHLNPAAMFVEASPVPELAKGSAVIVCDAAYYRDETLQVRKGILRRGDSVELTGRCASEGGLTFYESIIPLKVWIAHKDGEGTEILKNV